MGALHARVQLPSASGEDSTSQSQLDVFTTQRYRGSAEVRFSQLIEVVGFMLKYANTSTSKSNRSAILC